MVDDLNMGIIAFCNARERAPVILTAKVLEMILNDPSFDIYPSSKSARDKNLAIQRIQKEDLERSRRSDTKPTLPLEKYTGTYKDEMYGDIYIIKTNDNEMNIKFSHSSIFNGPLTHWQFDTFRIDWDDLRVPDGFLTFNFNSKGEVTGFTLDQGRLLDVDFNELNICRREK